MTTNGKPCQACAEKDSLIRELVKKCEALTDERDKLKAFEIHRKANLTRELMKPDAT